MSDKRDKQACTCAKAEAHKQQPIQYICLEDCCALNRLLCKSCVHESHRKHKVGIIDKLIEPLNRLNMNSSYQTALQDYKFLQERYNLICEEWQKLNEIFYNNMKELSTGILFQLNTVMKTFTNEEIDKAYEVLMNGHSKLEDVNQIVGMINFLKKDYLQDVEAVKKFASCISERVTKTINKAAKKVEIVLRKLQEHIKEIDFNKYNEYKSSKDKDQEEPEQSKDEKHDQLQIKDQEATRTIPISRKEQKKIKEQQHFSNELTNKYSFTNNASPHKGFTRYK